MNIDDELKIITRNVVDVLPNKEELKKLLQERRPLKIKYGVDPTAPDIHLGHTVVLWKLRDFQNLGHIVQFILGDFTAMIGDPSGRNEARKALSEDVVRDNAKTYLDQVFKILIKEKTEVTPNTKWFKQMVLGDFLGLASHYTVARVLERSEFKDRFVNKQEITLLEFIYPLLQGYDSVMLKNDIEMGGTDQTFNLLVGRDLQKDYGQKEQIVLTMPLLVGTDGTRKMSKTYGNYIGITDAPVQMFGKAMSITDNLIFTYFRLLTPVPETRIAGMELNVRSGEMNPRDAKAMLASELVTLYHGKEKALAASAEFDRIFKNKELPTEIPSSVYANSKEVWIVDVLVDNKLAKNKTEANRLIQQGAVELDGSVISVANYDITLEKEHILKVGKRRFLKIRGGKNTV